ncbi:hypothetical protein BDY21DRAFT_322306 [Lineolata rhizophorae]|uniref:Phosphoribosylaminoimidazole carboxylase n=1 Tax=Lineolata rhizophorae TaxID=578093 RepID=A0A6A6NYQ4_9PEZI|nr:hypothetical protein BDY21DRAFT_322306 [Lineolata rhizophorae]
MDQVVGFLGGGQLGRMTIEAANDLNIKCVVLDQGHSPAKQVLAHAEHVDGSFKDPASVKKLAEKCTTITVEIEHVDTYVMEEIEKDPNFRAKIEPHWQTIRTIQNKYNQKLHLHQHGVRTAEFEDLEGKSEEDIKTLGQKWGYPLMLKSKTEAYDGRGNFPVKSDADILEAMQALGGRPLYAERWANFKAEVAVMVVKAKNGEFAYPPVETVHEDSILKLVFAPARNVSKGVLQQAQKLATKAIGTFKGKGVYGVEMFLLEDDSLLVNEIAPRPHNSGHYTIEGCYMSQFQAHLHAILDLPIAQEDLELREPSIMLNILGGETTDSHEKVKMKALHITRKAHIHMYGKGPARKGRKMGHITVTAKTMAQAEALVQPIVDIADEVRGKPQKWIQLQPSSQSPTPLVAVIMGSDSDLPKLEAGIRILDKFSIPYEARITSAHRTPVWMAEYAESARLRGIKVIISAAGGAAHLPGMAASHTCLPVIGVPIKASNFDGLDSMFSIVQMPRGVPVATVGVNNSTNAALLAIRILGVGDPEAWDKTVAFAEQNKNDVLAKDVRLLEEGALAYLQKMS